MQKGCCIFALRSRSKLNDFIYLNSDYVKSLLKYLLQSRHISTVANDHTNLQHKIRIRKGLLLKTRVSLKQCNSLTSSASFCHFSCNVDSTHPFHQSNRRFSSLDKILPGLTTVHRTHKSALSDFLNLRYFHSSRRCAQNNDNSEKNDDKKDPKDDPDKLKKRLILAVLGTLFNIGLAFMIFSGAIEFGSLDYISYNEFYYNLLQKGEVSEIYLSQDRREAKVIVRENAIVKGKSIRRRKVFSIKIPENIDLEEQVRKFEREVNVPEKDRLPINPIPQNQFLNLLTTALILGLICFFIYKLGKTIKVEVKHMDPTEMFTKANFTTVNPTSKAETAITFKDVAGLREAKMEIIEFVDYLTNPKRFKDLGAKTPRGALLLGPPGCGKTLLARALSTEAKVPFMAMAGSEFVEMIGGLGASRVRNLFKEARKQAPCIIYIDEIDAVGRSRKSESMGAEEDEHTLNQLLVEMDGIGTQEGVIILGSTNRADILDKALLRPGRFDRHIMIDLPTLPEREEIFEVFLKKLKLAQPISIYAKPLARLTPAMSGADIANICNEAAIHAVREKHTFVDKENFEYAVERIVAGTEKASGLLQPEEKKVVAYHESGHALVGWLLKHTDALLRISIVPRTNSILGFAQYLPTEQKLYSKEELFERMCMALGGRAAEALVFNQVSTGAVNDLKLVTQLAYAQIRQYGMNEKVGPLSYPTDEESGVVKPFSQKLSNIIDEEARLLVGKAFTHACDVLKQNKDLLEKLSVTLLEKEVLDYDEIERLIGPPPHGKKNKMEPQGWQSIMRNVN